MVKKSESERDRLARLSLNEEIERLVAIPVEEGLSVEDRALMCELVELSHKHQALSQADNDKRWQAALAPPPPPRIERPSATATTPPTPLTTEPRHDQEPMEGEEFPLPESLRLPAKAMVGAAPTKRQEATMAPLTVAPMPKQRAQEIRITELLKERNHDPMSLTKRAPGKAGPKAEIKTLALNEPEMFTVKSFETAWQRLRDAGKIVEAQ